MDLLQGLSNEDPNSKHMRTSKTGNDNKKKKMCSSSSSLRAISSYLHRFSNGVSFKLPNATSFLRNLSSSSSISRDFEIELKKSDRVRNIWTFSPLSMGRRSCKIAGRKEAQNLKKMKLCSKLGKQVVSAIKKGGSNPVSNTVLAAIIEKAKELDVPKEVVDRNIKRASEKGQEAYVEKTYGVYGFGGISILIEVSTDKVNRSVAAVRDVVKDCGGKMADSGSVLFKFRRARVANIKVKDADKDQLLTIALDAGADDVIEPAICDDDSDEDESERYYKIVGSSENYIAILSKLRAEGIQFEPDNGSEFVPLITVEVDDEAMELNKELISNLLELDDVDAVYTDQKG